MAYGLKTGGRKAGTPNKRTKEIKQALQAIVANELDNLPAMLEALTAKERLDFVAKLIPYILPKPNPTHYTTLDVTLE